MVFTHGESEISRRFADLSMLGGGHTNLNQLLEQVASVIQLLSDLPTHPSGVMMLRNPRGGLIPIEYFNPEDQNEEALWADGLESEALDIGEQAYTRSLGKEPGSAAIETSSNQLLVLPLLFDSDNQGVLAYRLKNGWLPDKDTLEVLSDLSRIASAVMARYSTNEALKLRQVELELAHADAIYRLGVASEYRDNETGMHVMRMTHFAVAIGKAMGLSAELREQLSIAAPMHDVGKIGISDTILLKPGRLSASEFDTMKQHSVIGGVLLDGDEQLMQFAREVALTHHENWDGSGYPNGLRGEEIPLFGRICSVADVFDALISRRPYKEPWSVEQALKWIGEQSGIKFDPAVVNAFQQALPEILRIRELYRDEVINPEESLQLPTIAKAEEGSWVVWDGSLSVGIDAIDEHHRYLIDIINQLHDTVTKHLGADKVAKLMKRLYQYAQIHFSAEEKMMERYGYGEVENHQQMHNHFRKRLKQFYEELHISPLTSQYDVMTYLRDWLVRHIAIEDKKMAKLVEQEAGASGRYGS